jgi:exopolyphosphatase / guanosine-5'-triphosphate,3'-diphosphate pyrophosphatase
MVLAEIGPDGDFKVLESLQQAVSLGLDTFAAGAIKAEHVEECVNVLGRYRRVLEEYHLKDMSKVVAVATSAIREAENRESVLDRIYVATGIDVVCIDTAEVIRYTYMAVAPYIEEDAALRRGKMMVVEVGGGTTEVLMFRKGTVLSAHTCRLGSSRLRKLTEQYRTPQTRFRDLMQGHADRAIEAVTEGVPRKRPLEMLLLGSDARVAAAALAPDWNRKDLVRVRVSDLSRIAEEALEKPAERVAQLFGIPYPEAEILGPALLIYVRFAELLGVKFVSVGAVTLRDGIVRELAAGGGWTAGFRRQIVQSAIAVGRKYRFDEKHARQVARLSLNLFDRLQDEHGLGPRAEMILHVAALMHDIGVFVGASAHHKHSMYLIMNSDIFGLGSQDIRLAAVVARYHRRALPSAEHPEYMAFGREDRILVSKLAAILRVADALDRGHVRRCREIGVELLPGEMVLTAGGAGNLMMEQHGMREKGELFERVYGRRVMLRAAS